MCNLQLNVTRGRGNSLETFSKWEENIERDTKRLKIKEKERLNKKKWFNGLLPTLIRVVGSNDTIITRRQV